MLERPDGPALLAAAREALLAELLPALPAALQLRARMVANAMSIAAREAAAEPGALGAVPLLRLASEIRAGEHDPGRATHAAMAATLLALTRLRCGVSAPRALR